MADGDNVRTVLTLLYAVAEQALEELRKLDRPGDGQLIASVEAVRDRAYSAVAELHDA